MSAISKLDWKWGEKVRLSKYNCDLHALHIRKNETEAKIYFGSMYYELDARREIVSTEDLKISALLRGNLHWALRYAEYHA